MLLEVNLQQTPWSYLVKDETEQIWLTYGNCHGNCELPPGICHAQPCNPDLRPMRSNTGYLSRCVLCSRSYGNSGNQT